MAWSKHMQIKLLGLSAFLLCSSVQANDQNMRQNMFDYRVNSYQQGVDMKSYVGKWEGNCIFDELQQDYIIQSFEFEHPFLLKKTTQVFKNHICTLPRMSSTVSYQINHTLKKGKGIYILYSNLPEAIHLSISMGNMELMTMQLNNRTYNLRKVYR